MLKIRLMRIGAKKRPFYRVVVVDERTKRTGGYIEALGTYNPLTEPKDIKLKQDRIDYWVKQGAQASEGYLRMKGIAPQRPPRKPKKATTPAEATTPKKATEEVAKSSESEATSAVESAPETGTSNDSDSQQTRSEAQNTESEATTQEGPSGASTTDELPTKVDQPESETKHEGPA